MQSPASIYEGIAVNVKDLMTHHSATCTMSSNLEQVSLSMWNGDFGIMPVVDDEQRVIAVITDRDIAMASALQHRAPSQISVGDVAHQDHVVSCSPEDDVELALEHMETRKVRRLPVIDKQGHLAGMLSLADIAAYSGNGGKKNSCSTARLVTALKAIATPHMEEEKLVSRA